MSDSREKKNVIILAMFGTSVAEGLPGLLHIRNRMATGFPKTNVVMAFTSKILRGIWKEREVDQLYRTAHPEVPDSIFAVQSPKEIISSLSEKDVYSLVIQPVQIAPVSPGAFLDGLETPDNSNSLSFSGRIAFGRPALGVLDQASSYKKDIVRLARSLEADMNRARRENAALFYMGHGNMQADTDRVYKELVVEIRRQYPDVRTFMSMVEGQGSINDEIRELKENTIDKVVLKAFMVVAGNHARKEMVGRGDDSLHSHLVRAGIEVIPVMTGMGENNSFADIFVDHAGDAAREAGIDLG